MGTNRLTFSNELCATAIRIEWKRGRCRRGEKRQRRESNGEGRGRLRRKEGIENPPLFSILKTLSKIRAKRMMALSKGRVELTFSTWLQFDV